MRPPNHFLSLHSLGSDRLRWVLQRSIELKKLRGTPEHPRPIAGRTVAIVLEKASTRTRVSFEVGISELGGHPLTLNARDAQLGRGEPIEDTARVLSGYVHAIVCRTFAQDRLESLAAASRVPVINALTDKYHPCQLLADLMTVRECLGRVEDLSVAWIGDGNNMARSWIVAASLLGFSLRLACPEGYQPASDVLNSAQGDIRITSDPREAVAGVDVVTTDVWASMGQEEEQHARARAFAGYTVDSALMAEASPEAIFLHCLPAHRGEEVSADVIDGPNSRVWQEAENRLHSQKALLELLL